MYAIVMAHKLNELAQAGKQAEPCKHFWGQRFAVNAIGNFDKILAKKLPIFVLNQCYNFLENMTDRKKKAGCWTPHLHTSNLVPYYYSFVCFCNPCGYESYLSLKFELEIYQLK